MTYDRSGSRETSDSMLLADRPPNFVEIMSQKRTSFDLPPKTHVFGYVAKFRDIERPQPWQLTPFSRFHVALPDLCGRITVGL